MAENVENTDFEILKTLTYHAMRREFYSKCHRGLMFLVVISGAGAVWTFFDGTAFAPYLALIPTLAGLLDLVFDLTGHARAHELLYRKAADLYGQVKRDELKDKDAQRILHSIYTDEPITHMAVNAVAYNETCYSQGQAADQLEIPWQHRWLQHIWRFDGHHYPKANAT